MTIRAGSRRLASVATIGRCCARGLSVRPGGGLRRDRVAVAIKVGGLFVRIGLAIRTCGRFVACVLSILERTRIGCGCTATIGSGLRVLRYQLIAITIYRSIIGVCVSICIGDSSVIRVLPVLKGASVGNTVALWSGVGGCLLRLDPAG